MKILTYKEVVAIADQEKHNGYVQMYTNGDNICLHCLIKAKQPIPMFGWTPGECDHGYEDGSFDGLCGECGRDDCSCND